MIRVALRGLAGRKLRAALTAIAIVLGVAMISGGYVLTDTINSAFDTLFTQSYKNADVVIAGKAAFQNRQGNGVDTPTFPQSLLAKVKALPDVGFAAGEVGDNQTRLVDKNGKSISSGGAPNIALSIDPHGDQRFNPLTLKAGNWPSGPNEVAIDKSTADKKHFAIGDSIGVTSRGAERTFRISGIVAFSAVQSIGGATISIFDTPTAQRLFGKVGRLDFIRVQSKAGVPTSKLVSEIRPLLPSTAQAKDAAAQAKEDKKDVTGFLKVIQYALLAFGGIALFVGSFVIANTLSITIAQRVREFATLRTIGASRRQILWAVVIEAFVIGLFGSLAGLLLGLGIATGLSALLTAIGIDLPHSGTVFATRTVVVSLLVGTIVTLLASLRPALRATRVPPIAAVREGFVLPPGRFARFRTLFGVLVTVLAIGLLALGLFVHGAVAQHLLALGVGLLLLFVGVAIFAPRLVPPLASVLGWPAARMGGVAGGLARDNAMRNPSRTASTAAAVMIGLGLVTFVALVGQGLRSSFESAVDSLFVGNYALTSSDTFLPLTVQAETALKKTPGATVSGIRAGSGKYLGGVHNLTAVEPNMNKVITLDWKEGSTSVPAQLGRDGMFTDDDFAKKHNLHLGSPVRIQTPSGQVLDVEVRGIFKKPNGGSPFAEATISAALFDAHYPRPQNEMALLNVPGGVTDANTATLTRELRLFPEAKVQTQSQFKKAFEKPINGLLSLLYALLGLSVIVSVFGVINTLVLSVFERTRELGMLRAVGMTRRQVRRMIRHESIVTALIGAAMGIAIGFVLAALVTTELSSQGFVFAVPYLNIVVFVLAAILVGILAAVLPARRASRLNVLQALQYE
ncbi:MAG: putative transport system permease protein [Actinomycetota bacterium]